MGELCCVRESSASVSACHEGGQKAGCHLQCVPELEYASLRISEGFWNSTGCGIGSTHNQGQISNGNRCLQVQSCFSAGCDRGDGCTARRWLYGVLTHHAVTVIRLKGQAGSSRECLASTLKYKRLIKYLHVTVISNWERSSVAKVGERGQHSHLTLVI